MPAHRTLGPDVASIIFTKAFERRHAVQVCMEDFEEGLKEVKPAFGAVTETLEAYRLNGIIDYGEHCRHLLSVCKQLVEQASPLCAASGSAS